MTAAAIPAAAAPAGEVRRRRLALGGLGIGLAVLGFSLGQLWRPPRLPIVSVLPAFQLTDERGLPFGSEALRGKPYVADFIYTGCTDSCPRLTSQMAALQELLSADPDAVRLVSFTVDPLHDPPAQLLSYASAAGAVPGRWVFLTGSLAAVTRVVEDGFHLPMLSPGAEGAGAAGLHAERFAVVDGRGQLRGFYPADARGRRELRGVLKRLLLGE